MRRILYWFGLVAALASAVGAQSVSNGTVDSAGGSPALLDAGANHRRWGNVTLITNALGRTQYRTNGAYQEIATGLNYLSNGVWTASSDEIQITPTGGQAVFGQHSVVFGTDIANSPVVHTISDRVLTSRIYGLAYFDYASGNGILIAQLTNSTGQLLPSLNQVLYPNCFSGLSASVRMEYAKGGFSQDVVLNEQLPDPVALGLSGNVVVQIWSEFINAADPAITELPAVEGLTAQRLDFGNLQIGLGRAFTIGVDGPPVVVYPKSPLISIPAAR